MTFEMTKPCPKCPFRADIKPYLNQRRAKEIVASITRDESTFACHQTTTFDDDGEPEYSASEKHCAGVLIMLERVNRPSQMMRIAERIGHYDCRKLETRSPVFKSFQAFIAAQPKTRARC